MQFITNKHFTILDKPKKNIQLVLHTLIYYDFTDKKDNYMHTFMIFFTNLLEYLL